MLYGSIVITCIGLSILTAMMRNPKQGTIGIVFVGTLITFLFGFCGNFALSVGCSCLCATLLVIAWHFLGRNPRRAIVLMVASGGLGHVITYVVWVLPDERAYATIRERMTAMNPDDYLIRPVKPAIQASLQIEGLQEFDEHVQVERQRYTRLFFYQRLHEDQVSLFVNHPAFGYARMIRPQRDDVDFYLPFRHSITQPQGTYTSQSRASVQHPTLTNDLSLSAYHRRSVIEFAFPIGWGWTKSPTEVRGFQSHQFGVRSQHEEPNAEWTTTVNTRWQLARLELIGLLLASKPRVYMTENLPRMDEAKTAPTRNLDEFESAGLHAIARGQELYLGQSKTPPTTLRMIGGIRAAKACTNCHGCEEGELLGAFSYVLTEDSHR